MISLRARDQHGRPIVILGLSHANLDRLRQGQPIQLDLAKLNLTGTVLIFAGKTEKKLLAEIMRHAEAGDTEIHTDAPPKEGLEST